MTVAKNYLRETEIDELNRIVVMWLDYAEDQAQRRKQVFLRDWEAKLNDFLRFNERRVLPNAGTISKEKADARAELEYKNLKRRAGLTSRPKPNGKSSRSWRTPPNTFHHHPSLTEHRETSLRAQSRLSARGYRIRVRPVQWRT